MKALCRLLCPSSRSSELVRSFDSAKNPYLAPFFASGNHGYTYIEQYRLVDLDVFARPADFSHHCLNVLHDLLGVIGHWITASSGSLCISQFFLSTARRSNHNIRCTMKLRSSLEPCVCVLQPVHDRTARLASVSPSQFLPGS